MKKAKRNKKKHQHFGLAVFFSTVVIISLLVSFFAHFKFTNRVKAQTVIKGASDSALLVEIASPSPYPSASPSPNPSPIIKIQTSANYGFGIPILTYHYIGKNPNPKDTARDTLEVVPDKFEAQMNYLAQNGYTPISPETLYGIFNKQTTVAKPVMLTFDDGYVDFYLNAFPILSKHRFHAVAFIPTGLMGTGYYMNWGQIKEIQSSGLVSFEDHSISHPNLTTMGYGEILRQFKESRETLQSQTGTAVNFVAYPYGAANDSVIAAAQKVGFIGGFGTWSGKASGPGLNMPRVRITGQLSLAEFISKL